MPQAFYRKVLEYEMQFEDLEELMPTVYNSLQQILQYEDEDFEEVFMMDFTISERVMGKTIEYELIPGGKNIAVTLQNKKEYVNKVVDHYLNSSIEKSFWKFKDGFFKVCSKDIIVILQQRLNFQ